MTIFQQKLAARFYDLGGAFYNVEHPEFEPDSSTQATRTTTVQNAVDFAATEGGGIVLVTPDFHDFGSITEDPSVTVVKIGIVNADHITEGTIPAARVPELAVTQHEAALAILASQLSGTIADSLLSSNVPLLDAANAWSAINTFNAQVYGKFFDDGGAFFNVKHSSYGVVGDGSTNDLAALQSVIDEAELLGGTLYFPDSDYLINGTLIVNSSNPVKIIGSSKARILLAGDNHALRLQGTGSHIVRGLIFDGNAQSDGRAIIVQSGPAARIERCTFDDIPASAIEIQATNEGTVITRNRMSNCGAGASVVAPFTSTIRAADVTDCEISFNKIDGGGGKGIDCGEDTTGNDNLLIKGNSIRDLTVSGAIGIGVGGAVDTRIVGNYIRNCDDNGIDCNAFNGVSHVGTVIAGNTMISCKDAIFVGHGAEQVSIGINVARSCDRGIRLLDGALYVNVNGMSIDGTTFEGILVTGTGGSNRRPGHLNIENCTLLTIGTVGVKLHQCNFVKVNGVQMRNVQEHGVQGDDADESEVSRCIIRSIGLDAANTYDAIFWSSNGGTPYVHNNVVFGATRNIINMANAVNGVIEHNYWQTDGSTANVTGIHSTTVSRFNRKQGTVPSAYTPSNVTTDRSYDADSTSTAELADVLGSLIADLQSQGILS